MIEKQLCEWSIKEVVGKTIHGNKIHRCVCKCGNERNFTLSYINAAKNFTKCKSCKRKEADAVDDVKLIGKILGTWTVLKQTSRNKYGSKRWICQCICGKRRTFLTSYLNGQGIRPATKCMQCYVKDSNNTKKYSYVVSDKFFKKIKIRANRDCKEFSITIQYLQDLFNKQKYKCKISGLPISFTFLTGKNYDINTTASLDRIDNTKGYIEGNVQFVHKHVNFMKWKLEEKYFLDLCKQIAKHNT